MNLRQWLNNNSALVTIITVVVLIVALVIIIRSNLRTTPKPPESSWYYDTGTGRLVVGKPGLVTPFAADSGAEVVSAIVFHCGSCKTEPIIAYLMKYTDEYKQYDESMRQQMQEQGQPPGAFTGPGMMRDDMSAQLIAVPLEEPDPEGLEWMSMIDPAAAELLRDAISCPGGEAPNMRCRPPKL